MSKVEDLYATLKTEVLQIQADVEKVAKGQKAAGVRVRKSMMATRSLASDIRKAVLEQKEGASDDQNVSESAG